MSPTSPQLHCAPCAWTRSDKDHGFDPKWLPNLPEMPHAVSNADPFFTFMLDGRFHVVGGYSCKTAHFLAQQRCGPGKGSAFCHLQVLDMKSRTWSLRASAPIIRFDGGAVHSNRFFYISRNDDDIQSQLFTYTIHKETHTPADAWANAWANACGLACTRLSKRLGTCHGSRRHLPSGQATGVCHGVCCKAPAMAPAMQAPAHAMQAPAHAMKAPAHAMGHMPCSRTTRGKMM